MQKQEAQQHHYVPQFLLRPWAIGGSLRGYYWDSRRAALCCNKRGPKAFCNELNLLTLTANQGHGRDVLETKFFGYVDDLGAEARDILVAQGTSGITPEQRCNFARLLLSLDARRPSSVVQIRDVGAEVIASTLNDDAEVLTAMTELGMTESPSEFYERQAGVPLADRALGIIQSLVDNPEVGKKLINAYWEVVHLKKRDTSLVLSDRPLIRAHGYNDPRALWILPLTPKIVFVAESSRTDHDRLLRTVTNRLAKKINVAGADQADRYVFSVDEAHTNWLPKYLSKKSKQ
jgi:hypothetical protein